MPALNPQAPWGRHGGRATAPPISPHTDPPARHAQSDVLLGRQPRVIAAHPWGSQPAAVRQAVGQGGQHLLLLLGAAQALVVTSLAHGSGGGWGALRLPGGGEGWSRARDHMAESCCSSGKQREGEGDRGDGGEEGGGRMDAEGRGKENGEPPKVPVLTVALLFSSQLRSLRVPPGSQAWRRGHRRWHHRSPRLPPAGTAQPSSGRGE